MSKAYFIDSDNICNFTVEFLDLMNDINVEEDMVYIFYTIEGNKSRAVQSLNRVYKIGLNNMRLQLCEPGRNSLDNDMIAYIKKNIETYDKYIIISNDKGYDSSLSEYEKVNRRGSLELKTLHDVEKAVNEAENLGKLYGLSKAKLEVLDKMVGKYVVAFINSSGKHSFYQNEDIQNDRRWTYYLNDAECFDKPAKAEEFSDKCPGDETVVIFVTKSMVESAKSNVYAWFFKAMENQEG